MGSDASALAQPRPDAVQGKIARKRKLPTSTSSRTTERAKRSPDWRADRIREWLLLLLRFAITRDPKDEAAAFAMADEIDAAGLRWRPSGPSFFRRTTGELCQAITALDNPKRAAILRSHIARIDDPRLRKAFQAAVELERKSPPASAEAKRRDLWTGLRR